MIQKCILTVALLALATPAFARDDSKGPAPAAVAISKQQKAIASAPMRLPQFAAKTSWMASCRAGIATTQAIAADNALRLKAAGEMIGDVSDSTIMNQLFEYRVTVKKLQAVVASCADTPAKIAQLEAATAFNAKMASDLGRLDAAGAVMQFKRILIGRTY